MYIALDLNFIGWYLSLISNTNLRHNVFKVFINIYQTKDWHFYWKMFGTNLQCRLQGKFEEGIAKFYLQNEKHMLELEGYNTSHCIN